MTATVLRVVPQPVVDVRVADGQTGQPVRMTTYRGLVVIGEADEGFRIVRLPEHNEVAFFLPDSLPYPAGTEATVSVLAMVNLQAVSGGDHTSSGPYGLHGIRAALVDDPRGSGWRYVQVSFVNTYASKEPQVQYEVTVLTPLDP